MYFGFHVKYPFFCPILMKLKFSQQIFENYSNKKFHESPLGDELFHEDRRAYRHEANIHIFAILRKTPNKYTVFGQNVGFFNIKPGGTSNMNWALEGYI